MNVALFPLNTVLFPGGVLPLRIFEARYMDMVRECMRREEPFGVSLIVSGSDTGPAARTESVGCMAHIAAWDMEQLGLLHLRTIGGQRFRVLRTQVQADQLQRVDIELLPPDEDAPVEPDHQACAALLTRVLDDVRAQHAERRRTGQAEGDVMGQLPFAEPFQLDSSVWVGNRLCEILPVPMKAKQKLMELDDAHTRLEIITQYLKQHAVLK